MDSLGEGELVYVDLSRMFESVSSLFSLVFQSKLRVIGRLVGRVRFVNDDNERREFQLSDWREISLAKPSRLGLLSIKATERYRVYSLD